MTHIILHKVRGEPAYDVASKIRCPVCEPMRQGLDDGSYGNCDSCEDGSWWIIPTSGHRAYPYKTWRLDELGFGNPSIIPDELPDHYEVDKGERPKSNFNVMSIISGLRPKIKRRL
jgi:hypothetical protein